MTKRETILAQDAQNRTPWLDDPRNRDVFYDVINRHRKAAAFRSAKDGKQGKRNGGSSAPDDSPP